MPTVNLVVPVRYTHAHYGVMDRADFDGMVELVVALLQKLDAKTVTDLRDFTRNHELGRLQTLCLEKMTEKEDVPAMSNPQVTAGK